MTLNSNNVMAAEWSITPRVSLGGEYSDNIYLSATNPNEVSGINVTPEVSFNRTSPNSTTSIGARAQLTQFSDKEIRDTNVQYLTFNSRYKPQQRTTWRVKGTLRSDTTVSTVRNVGDLIDSTVIDEVTGEPVDTNAGLVEVQARRRRLNLDPSWQHNLTERTSLRVGYRFLDVYYTGAEGTNLVDYRAHFLDTTLSRQLTQNDSLGMTLQVSQYKSENDSKTDNLTVNASLDHTFERDLKSNFAVGYRDTTTTTGDVEDKSGGAVIRLGINKRETKLTSYNISLTRDISASGIGRVVQSDQLNIRLNTRFTPKLSATLRVNAFDNQALEGDISSDDRIYYSVEPGLQWLMTRNWAIDGSYRFRHQKRELDLDAAESNSIYVSINYTWPKIAASR